MPMTKKSLVTAAVLTLGGLGLSGCATTDYVDEQIAAVNARIDGVDARVSQNAQAAAAAQSTAQAAAADAQNANRRIDALTGRVDRLEQQAAAAAAARRPRN